MSEVAEIGEVNAEKDAETLLQNRSSCKSNSVLSHEENNELTTNPSDVNHIEVKYVEEYVISDDDDMEAIEEQEVDESTLDMRVSAWPVTIHFQTQVNNTNRGDSTVIELSDDDSEDDNDDDSSDEDNSANYDSVADEADEESLPSVLSSSHDNSSDINVRVGNRKRKKLSKRRKVKKRHYTELKCHECLVQFNTDAELNMHLCTVHKMIGDYFSLDKRYSCRLCKQRFNNKVYLEAHVTQMHTEKRSINCIKCKKVFKYRSYLTSTNNNSNNVTNSAPTYKSFKCFYCNVMCR